MAKPAFGWKLDDREVAAVTLCAQQAGQVAKVRERTSPSGWPILTAER